MIESSGTSPGPQSRMTGERSRLLPRTSAPHMLLNVIAALIAGMMLLPLTYLIWRSLSAGNALDLIFRASTVRILWNSVLLAALVTGFSLLLSLPLAWLTVRTDLPGRRLWSVLITLPLVFPSYVGGYALVAMLGPRGMVQNWLEPLGVERLPSVYGLVGATYALTIFTFPYLLLTIRAGLRNLDPALEEASRGMGYGPWQTFRRVTLPALRPAIAAGVLLVALYVLSDFGAVSILRYNSFTRAIYVQYLSSFDRSYAALLSLVLVALTLLLLFGAQRIQGRSRPYYRMGAGAARSMQRQALGAWRWPALALCGSVVLAGLFVPLSVVVYWLVRGLRVGEPLLPAFQATFHSVQASTLAALAAIILALPVAYLAVRFPSRYSNLISQSVYVGYGLPGIVIALSLVFFGANFLPWLYQTLTMLIFAYVVRFLPQATGTVRTSLLRMSPRLEEAARSMGASRSRTIGRITLPLLRPGIWTGAALVFLSTMKELPATLLLGPTGFTTLATQIWSATQEAFFTRAAVPSLILLAVSAVSIAIILGQEERDAS